MASDEAALDDTFDSLYWNVLTDTLVRYCSYLHTLLIAVLALQCVTQHCLCTPKRLELPGNEVYRRIAWFKLLSGSLQLILYFGYNPVLIYPCCDMLSVHFRALLPVFDAKSYFVFLTISSIVSRFAQIAFILKRWQANMRGLWFPSFTALLTFQLSTLFAGTVFFVYYWQDDLDIFNVDSFGYCLHLGVNMCNKYSVEEDHNHVHIDFRTVACLRAVSLMDMLVSFTTITVFCLQILLRKYDMLYIAYVRDTPLHLYINKDNPLLKDRRSTLAKNSMLSSFAIMYFSVASNDVLYRNFPHSVSSTASFDHLLTHVIDGEFLSLLKSENYYSLFDIPEIVRNLRNGSKWNEGILHPRLEFSDSDYY